MQPAAPEAALGRDKFTVYRPVDNVQLASDLDSPFLLCYLVLAQANDAGALGPLRGRVGQAEVPRVTVTLGDAGYAGGADLAAGEAAGVALYAPWQANDYSAAGEMNQKQIPKEQFVGEPAEQTYRCSEGTAWSGWGRRRRSVPAQSRRC